MFESAQKAAATSSRMRVRACFRYLYIPGLRIRDSSRLKITEQRLLLLKGAASSTDTIALRVGGAIVAKENVNIFNSDIFHSVHAPRVKSVEYSTSRRGNDREAGQSERAKLH